LRRERFGSGVNPSARGFATEAVRAQDGRLLRSRSCAVASAAASGCACAALL
jgi:hypothetical protein